MNKQQSTPQATAETSGKSGMKRFVVIGCGGSGKSHFARALGETLGLPVTHLDTLFYDEHWQPRPPTVFATAQEQLVAEPSWIIEGNYASTLPIRLAAADRVVFLDLPPAVCLLGIWQRHRRYGAGQHAGGVYNRITVGFVWYVLTYRYRMRPRVRALLAEHAPDTPVVTLTSRRRTDAALEALRSASRTRDSATGS